MVFKILYSVASSKNALSNFAVILAASDCSPLIGKLEVPLNFCLFKPVHLFKPFPRCHIPKNPSESLLLELLFTSLFLECCQLCFISFIWCLVACRAFFFLIRLGAYFLGSGTRSYLSLFLL